MKCGSPHKVREGGQGEPSNGATVFVKISIHKRGAVVPVNVG